MNTRSKKNRSKKKQKGGQANPPWPCAPAPACPPPSTTPETYDIFIIAGQSNAIGRGTRNHNPTDSTRSTGSYFISPDDCPNCNIKQLTSTRDANFFPVFTGSFPSNLVIAEAKEPIGGPFIEYIPGEARMFAKTDKTIGFGLSFAKKYSADNPTKKVLLLGCGFSIGGSYVLTPPAGDSDPWWFYERNNPKSLFFQIHRILTWAKTRNLVHPNSAVKGLLWSQGEQDMPRIRNYPSNKIIYKTKIKDAFTGFRNGVNTIFPLSTSTFPIIMTGMCVGNSYYNGNIVSTSVSDITKKQRIDMNDYLRTLSIELNTEIQNVIFTETGPLSATLRTSRPWEYPLQSEELITDATGTAGGTDIAHFSATSYRLLGERQYNNYKQLTSIIKTYPKYIITDTTGDTVSNRYKWILNYNIPAATSTPYNTTDYVDIFYDPTKRQYYILIPKNYILSYSNIDYYDYYGPPENLPDLVRFNMINVATGIQFKDSENTPLFTSGEILAFFNIDSKLVNSRDLRPVGNFSPNPTSIEDTPNLSSSMNPVTVPVRYYDAFIPKPAPQPLPSPAPLPQPLPAPLPQPRPAPLPQPRPVPLPQPRPVPLPQPRPAALSQPQPRPAALSQPQPRPAALSQPQPRPAALSQPQPRPAALSQPQPRPVALSQPQPRPAALSQPQPRPAALPQPLPVPLPQPLPVPLPQPRPAALSQPQPRPAPLPAPLPASFPQPFPQPFPEPFPQPFPQPFPEPFPQPFPQPFPEPFPQPQPQPAPRPRQRLVPPPAVFIDKRADFTNIKFIEGNKPFKEDQGSEIKKYLDIGHQDNQYDKTTYPMLNINKYSHIYSEYPFHWKY